MIWLSVNRDFFMVEIFLRELLLFSALVLRGDYRTSETKKPLNIKGFHAFMRRSGTV